MDVIDKIYIINLDERRDRYDALVKEFKRVGITDYIRFPAVRPSLDDYDTTRNKYASQDPNYIRGSLGCKLSHLAILKHARNNGYKYILIFEDDVEFTESNTGALSRALKILVPAGEFTLLYLSANLYRAKLTRVGGVSGVSKISNALCAHSYVVNCKEINYLIRGLEASLHEVDVFYKQVQLEKKCYILAPGITKQRAGYSNIMERKVVYETIG